MEASDVTSLKLNTYPEWSTDEFELFRQTVIDLHDLKDGVTLCKECHMEIDPWRNQFQLTEYKVVKNKKLHNVSINGVLRKSKFNQFQIDEILVLLKNNVSHNEICRKMQCSRSTVSNLKKIFIIEGMLIV